MSQSSTHVPDVSAPSETAATSESVNVQVVSPTVPRLSFPQLSAATTVKQLKEKIRDALPDRPSDSHQRLIHRGRLLARESETMLDIFGADAIGNTESYSIHLVLRPSSPDQPPAPEATRNVANPADSLPPPITGPPLPDRAQSTSVPGFGSLPPHASQNPPDPHNSHHLQALTSQIAQMQQLRLQQLAEGRFAQPSGDSQHRPQHQQLHFQHRPLPNTQGSLPPHDPTQYPILSAQTQQDRAGAGIHGVASNAMPLPPPHGVQTRAHSQPPPGGPRENHVTTYTREGVGPNGERWRVTVNESTTILHSGLDSSPQLRNGAPQDPQLRDVQNLIHNADLAQSRPLIRPSARNMEGVPSPFIPTVSGPQPTTPLRSGSAPPASLPNLSPLRNNTPLPPSLATRPLVDASGNNSPMVYILSSPSGPRALLVDNAESFFTPRQRRSRSRHASSANPLSPPNGAPVGFPEYRNRPHGREHRHRNRDGGPAAAAAAAAAGGDAAPAGVAAAAAAAHPGHNPHVGAAAVLAQLWPHLWLIVRLIVFVWFFTAGNNSWPRLFMVSGLAVLVFVINTGIFHNAADQAWAPFRRHLEGLIPLAGPLPAAGNQNPNPQQQQQQQTGTGTDSAAAVPDPASAAARLVARRRDANGGWLVDQVRRVEHAMLLFIASLVPGVGERHIAAREAEANVAAVAEAERLQRLQAAAAEQEQEQERVLEQAQERERESGSRDAAVAADASGESNAERPVGGQGESGNDAGISGGSGAGESAVGSGGEQGGAGREAEHRPLIDL